VAFLRNLGYEAESPGDEVDVPHEVCRPLRLLGDLYFESGSEDEIKAGNPPKENYYDTPALSQDQLAKLRAYVESHPSFIGGIQTDLGDEIEDIPSATDDEVKPRPRIDPDARTVRYASDGRLLLPEPFYFGQIERRSNKGNAMLSTPAGKHCNLGRLPKSAVGAWTVAASYRGHWMMCLTPQLWGDGYRSDARNHVDQLETLTGLTGLDTILNIDARMYDDELQDSQITAYIYFAGHGIGVAYHGEWTILVDSELVAAGQRVTVTVQDTFGTVAIATPSRPQENRHLSTGDRVTLNVDIVGDNLLIGAHQGELLTVPRETETVPEQLNVAVTDTHNQYVTAAVSALPASELPPLNECVTIQNGQINAYPDIPVAVPDTLLKQSVPVRLPVADVHTDAVTVSATLLADIEPFSGSGTLESTTQHWTDEGLVIQKDSVPILVHGGRYVPGLPVTVRPTGFEDGYVTADFESFTLQAAPDTVTAGIEAGNRALRAQNFHEALSHFTASVELGDTDTSPDELVDAILHEILCLTALRVADDTLVDALTVLEIRTELLGDMDSLSDTLRETASTELEAYRHTLQAQHHLHQVDQTTDKIEQTMHRKAAKEKLTVAVETLTEFQSQCDWRQPHWLIDEQLETVADDLLSVSPAVTAYLNDKRN